MALGRTGAGSLKVADAENGGYRDATLEDLMGPLADHIDLEAQIAAGRVKVYDGTDWVPVTSRDQLGRPPQAGIVRGITRGAWAGRLRPSEPDGSPSDPQVSRREPSPARR